MQTRAGPASPRVLLRRQEGRSLRSLRLPQPSCPRCRFVHLWPRHRPRPTLGFQVGPHREGRRGAPATKGSLAVTAKREIVNLCRVRCLALFQPALMPSLVHLGTPASSSLEEGQRWRRGQRHTARAVANNVLCQPRPDCAADTHLSPRPASARPPASEIPGAQHRRSGEKRVAEDG